MGKNVREIDYSFDFMNEDVVATHVDVYKDGSVDFVNYTDDLLDRAFGYREEVDFYDVYRFFASRILPKERATKEVLAGLGLKEYDPKEIIKKTYGLNIEDRNWVRFEGVNLTFKEADYKLYGDNLIR